MCHTVIVLSACIFLLLCSFFDISYHPQNSLKLTIEFMFHLYNSNHYNFMYVNISILIILSDFNACYNTYTVDV